MRRGLGTPRPLTLPQNLLLAPGTLWEDFETVADWTAAGGTVAANASEFKTCTKSVKLTSNAGATATMTKTVNWDMSTFQRLSVWMYLHNTTLTDYGGSIHLQLSNDAGFANYFRAWWAANELLHSGWNRMHWSQGYFKVGAGAPSWSSPIVRLRFQIQAAASLQAAVSFDSLHVGLEGVPGIMLHFDDGYASAYSVAYAKMKTAGLRGTVFVDTSKPGLGNYLTWAQAKEMDAAGWSIANHTDSATNLTTLTEAQQETALTNAKNALEAQGLTKASRYVAYPSGGWNANTMTAMTNLGMLVGRTVKNWGHDTASTMPPVCLPYDPDWYYMRMWDVTSAKTLVAAEAVVDSLIADGVVGVFLFHDIGGSGQWDAATFNAFIDYLVTKKGQFRDLTVDDFYKLSLGGLRIKGARR